VAARAGDARVAAAVFPKGAASAPNGACEFEKPFTFRRRIAALRVED
jgi:hypothetical protein